MKCDVTFIGVQTTLVLFEAVIFLTYKLLFLEDNERKKTLISINVCTNVSDYTCSYI